MEWLHVKQSFMEKMKDGYQIFCDITQMGKDCTICVWGGDTPHVGSVVMSVARPSLTGEGTSVTSSVINGIGHKDEYIARKFAEAVAEKFYCTAVCTCGIHIDNISVEQIQEVEKVCDRLYKFVEAQLKQKDNEFE